MSNCSQNCWIIWNSAALCLKRLFCRICEASLLATILCVWEIWSGSNHIHVFHLLPKKQKWQKSMSPHWFWSRTTYSMTRNQSLFLWSLCMYVLVFIVVNNIIFFDITCIRTCTNMCNIRVKGHAWPHSFIHFISTVLKYKNNSLQNTKK